MTKTKKHKRTGLAIIVVFFISIILMFVYMFVFTLFVEAFAYYDESFRSGLLALILVIFVPNILSFLSAVFIVKRIFPNLDSNGLFYGLSTLVVVMGIISILAELYKQDVSVSKIIINILVIICIIITVKLAIQYAPTKNKISE